MNDARMADAADLLRQLLEEAEERIRELKIGMPVSVPLPTRDTTLCFNRAGERWSLCIETPGKQQRLTEWSRAQRIAAARALPALLQKLNDAGSGLLRDMEEACGIVEEFIKSFPVASSDP